jgi:hypothetical protein
MNAPALSKREFSPALAGEIARRMSDLRIVGCEACSTEGRIYHGNGDKPWHYVEECPYCEGTGGEIITTQPIEMADLDEGRAA